VLFIIYREGIRSAIFTVHHYTSAIFSIDALDLKAKSGALVSAEETRLETF